MQSDRMAVCQYLFLRHFSATVTLTNGNNVQRFSPNTAAIQKYPYNIHAKTVHVKQMGPTQFIHL